MLGEAQGDGATLRTHLQRLARNTGRVDDRLYATCPPGCTSLWSLFLQLSATRQVGMGASPIQFTEIDAWSRLQHLPINPWELDTLLALDALTLRHAAKTKQKDTSQ